MELSGYVGKNTTQPQSALDMMQFMYLWLPLIFDVLILVILSKMNVEAESERIKLQRGIGSDIRHEIYAAGTQTKSWDKNPSFLCLCNYLRNNLPTQQQFFLDHLCISVVESWNSLADGTG